MSATFDEAGLRICLSALWRRQNRMDESRS
jgi:hypothetical protein